MRKLNEAGVSATGTRIPAKKISRKTNTTLWIKLIKNSTMVAGKTVGFIIASALGERMDQLK